MELQTVRYGPFPVWLCAVALSALFCGPAAAQDPPADSVTTPPAPAGQTPTSQTQAAPGRTQGKKAARSRGTSNDRLFWTLPNFLTLEHAGEVPPLTAAQKFKVTARGAFDPIEFVWYGALAGISQWENSESGFGQGAEGYGKRYGTYFADGTIENFMTAAVLPSLLHQDPRYFQMGKGGFWRRSEHAIGHIFVTRTDKGANQFNFSEIFGSAAAAGISTYTYHPRGDRNFDNALSVWGSEVGYDALTYVIKEFWPDIRRKLHPSRAAQKQ